MAHATSCLQRLIASRGADGEAAAWAAGGLAAWLNSGGAISLPRCLGLPTSAASVRTDLRNLWLREACEHLDGETPWAKCVSLRAAIQRFEIHRWAAWRKASVPPSRATPLEKCLFFARGYGAFPGTVRMLRNIIAE